MLAGLNPKILGSIVVGSALVLGAFVITSFGKPRMDAPAAVIESQAPMRVAISVTDKDNNGVEDWRDELVPDQTSSVIQQASTTYELPTTLTGRMSIQLLQNYTQAKNNGPFGSTREEVVADAVTTLQEGTRQSLFDTKDITIIEVWNEEDVKNYANSMASAIINNDIKDVDQELNIMYAVMVEGKKERLEETKIIAGVYKNTLDDSIAIPVPTILVKQHLDLINSYSALYEDVSAMSQTLNDPAAALIRLKRYQDDALGLRLSLENMFVSITPYENMFSSNDPAVFFANFNPQNNRVQ